MTRRLAASIAFVLALSLLICCASRLEQPPRETGSFRRPDLVEIVTLDPTIRLDIRYATSNNFTGRPVYRQARAFLQRPAAEALVRVNASLRDKGYGLLVFDGYRPWSVTKLFWDITSPEKRAQGFVANPAKGSKHNRGAAVDLSIYELATGKEAAMPSGYDEFSERAAPGYAGGTEEQRARRDLLRAAMEKEGFAVDPGEWWHYNYADWESYPILDIPFEAIPAAAGAPAAGLPSAAAAQTPLPYPLDLFELTRLVQERDLRGARRAARLAAAGEGAARAPFRLRWQGRGFDRLRARRGQPGCGQNGGGGLEERGLGPAAPRAFGTGLRDRPLARR